MDKPCCIELAANAFAAFWKQHAPAIQAADRQHGQATLCFPTQFDSKSLWARMYRPEHGLGFHQDPPNDGFVLVLSLGADIDFSFYLQDRTRVSTIRVRSGDAVILNGSVVHHAITRVFDNTPGFWGKHVADDGVGAYQYSRVGLQMRCRK